MKKSELRQLIREELQKELFGFSKKPSPLTPQAQVPKSKQITPGEITVEGISATGKGYSVWRGSNPIGDLRQMIKKYPNNGLGEIEVGGNIFEYYYVTKRGNASLKDHVGRPAYFTISALKGSVGKSELQKVADEILAKNAGQEGIRNYTK